MLTFLRSFLDGGVDGKAAGVPASPTDPIPAVTYFAYATLTTTPLAGNAAYTSAPIDFGLSPVAKNVIVLAVSVDQTGVLTVQASDDGLTWYTYSTSGTVTSAGLSTSVNSPGGRYARIVYTNGSTNQGSFRLAYGLK